MVLRSIRIIALTLCATLVYSQSGAYADLLAKAHAGDGPAAYSLGRMYENPTKGDPDYKGAAYWYTQASNRGVDDASIDLAMFYLSGIGVARDDTRALDLLVNAAKNRGSLKGMTRLGEVMMATRYQGNGRYYGEPWIEKAAAGGEPDALNDMGWLKMTSMPSGVAPDVRAALPYFLKAAQRGSCLALINMGDLYFNGSYEYHFMQDAKEAQHWFDRVQSCPAASLQVKQHAAELSARAARGELPPLSRQERQDYRAIEAQKTQDETIAAGVIASIAAVLVIGAVLPKGSGNNGASGSRFEENINWNLDACLRAAQNLAGGNPWACGK